MNSSYKLKAAITHFELEVFPPSGHWQQLPNKIAAVAIGKTSWRALSSVKLQKNKAAAFLSSVTGRINHALRALQFQVAGSEATLILHILPKNAFYTSIPQQYFHTLSTSNAVEDFRESDYFKTLLLHY